MRISITVYWSHFCTLCTASFFFLPFFHFKASFSYFTCGATKPEAAAAAAFVTSYETAALSLVGKCNSSRSPYQPHSCLHQICTRKCIFSLRRVQAKLAGYVCFKKRGKLDCFPVYVANLTMQRNCNSIFAHQKYKCSRTKTLEAGSNGGCCFFEDSVEIKKIGPSSNIPLPNFPHFSHEPMTHDSELLMIQIVGYGKILMILIGKLPFQTEHVQTIYQCTWPGCDVRKELCDDIESHVREKHLR